jgi:hypothetical protein
MHTLRHYRVRLRRSDRLRYRLARHLLGALILLVILGIAYIINR